MVLGIAFAFSNGYRDSSSLVATVVSTRTLGPNAAFSLCALFELLGALFVGTAVASTIGQNFFNGNSESMTNSAMPIAMAALSSSVLWGVLSWWRAMPTSNSHALMGGLTGAGWAAWGAHQMQSKAVILILFVFVAGPFIGFLLSWAITLSLRWVGGWLTKRARPMAQAMHVLACLSVACAHGSNNSQLALGALLPLLGSMAVPTMPFSVRLIVAVALSAGVLFGGRRLLKRLGMQFYRIRDPQGVGAEFATAGTMFACSITGFPASTTQVIVGSIMGAAAAKDMRQVRWPIAKVVALSWLVTFPAAIALSYSLFLVFQRMFA